MQARALAVSTVLTGVLGAAGFYALRAHGFFSADTAELLPAKEVARFMRSPLVRGTCGLGCGYACLCARADARMRTRSGLYVRVWRVGCAGESQAHAREAGDVGDVCVCGGGG